MFHIRLPYVGEAFGDNQIKSNQQQMLGMLQAFTAQSNKARVPGDIDVFEDLPCTTVEGLVELSNKLVDVTIKRNMVQ